MATKKGKIARGIITAGILVVAAVAVNSIVNSFGDTLSQYIGGGTVGSSDPNATWNDENCLKEGREMDSKLEEEGSVLLRNDGTLPLAKGSKVTLLNGQCYNYVCGGTGSAGGAIDANTYSMKEAFDGTHSDSYGANGGVSKEKYLDVNAQAWNWLETAVGGYRNADTSGEYVGHKGDGTLDVIKGSEYPGADLTNPTGSKDNYGKGDWGGYTRVAEFQKSVYESHVTDILVDGYKDVAIVSFNRSGAEGASPVMDYDGDGKASTGTTYLQLSEDERGVLEFAKANFKKTIVLVNSSTPMELGEIEQEQYRVNAALWIGHPGEAGLVGVAKVLTGEVCPSGHLVDTYAYDMSTAPSFYNMDDNKYANLNESKTAFGDSNSSYGYYQYEEGIYVGYRFYETADAAGYFDSTEFKSHAWKNNTANTKMDYTGFSKGLAALGGYDNVVQYPFGYGLSYTTFEQKITSGKPQLRANGEFTIDVKVTNTGAVAGKDVVQIYVEAPFAQDDNAGIKNVGLQKSAKALVGFAKTKTLDPHESETLSITINSDDVASFDSYGYGCYVLEKGEYKFHAGKNAHEDYDSIATSLGSSIVYNEKNAGARYSDKQVAKVALADVDAGDGNMLDGYLSRTDFAGGMAQIMTHESSCKTESLKETAKAAIETGALGTTDFSFETYEGGVKVTKTVKKYVNGTSYLAYSAGNNWEGLNNGSDRYMFDDMFEDHLIDYGAKYYLHVEDDVVTVTTNDQDIPLRLDNEDALKILGGLNYDSEVWAYLADQTTLEEQISVQGGLGWNTPAIDSVGKLRVSVVDGPGEAGNGNSSYVANTWWTSAVVNASTWNVELLEELGHAYGHQSIKSNLGGAYAPACNTHRSPFGGRNFEYFSEDGFIGGCMAAAEVTGLQAEGVVVYIKHMAMNDGDTNRDGNITWFAEQAAREIMLKDYEIACHFVFNPNTKKLEYTGENCLGIMASLNRDGISMFHQGLYKTILRGEWGFNGLIITDGVGPSANIMSPVAGLYGGVEGQLGGSAVTSSNYASVEGNAKNGTYGRYLLRQCTKHLLYQTCHSVMLASSLNESWKTVLLVADIIMGLGILTVIGTMIVLPAVKKEEEVEYEEVAE